MKTCSSEIDSTLKNDSKVVIVGHFNPDGDSVGSLCAMYHYLKGRCAEVTPVLPSLHPVYLDFLSPVERPILIYEKQMDAVLAALSGADVIICLDLNRLSRTEYLEDAISGSRAIKILIDHHPFPQEGVFDIMVSSTEVSSACELLFWVLMEMGDVRGDVMNLNMKCADALYVGMMTDTNNFSNSVFPTTFRMASALMERGVDKTSLQDRVLSSHTESRMRLMGHLLKDNLRCIPGTGVAYMTLSNEEKDQYGFRPGDSEGFVNLPLSIGDVRFSALFTQNFDGAYIRVSLRSKGHVDVNEFSKRYCNGGGHVNASGGRLFMPLEAVPEYFEKCIREYLDV